jgi:hypothetical protein
MATSPAVSHVFGVLELFEEAWESPLRVPSKANLLQILQYLDLEQLFRLKRVNRLFNLSIKSSPVLARKMFLRSSLIGNTVIPLRIDMPHRRRPVKQTIWAKTPTFKVSEHAIAERPDRVPDDVLIKLCEDRHVDRPVLNPFLTQWHDINNRMNTILLKKSPVSHVDTALRLVPHSCKGIGEHDSRRKMLVTQPPTPDVVVGMSDTLWGLYEAHNADGVTIGDVLDAERAYNWFRAANIPVLTQGNIYVDLATAVQS